MSFFQNLHLPSPSIWLVFIAGILFALIIWRLVVTIPKARTDLKKRLTGVRQTFSVSSEVRLRQDVYHFAQKQHLASALFSLDEIAVVPRVLTPLIQASSSIDLAPTDSVSLVVPYIPDWPELAAVYKASTMTLVESLQGGANVILAGHPGSGKTVALAWLASAMARNQPGLGILEGLLPVYAQARNILPFLHPTDERLVDIETESGLNLQPDSRQMQNHTPTIDDVLELLVKAVAAYVSAFTLPRLSGIIRSAIEKRRALFILDGLDELPPQQAAEITKFIYSLQETYPTLRMLAASSYEDLSGLPVLGFSLLGMAAWGEDDRAGFLSRWSRLWTKWIYPTEKDSANKINTHYLNSWLKTNNSNLNPLEYVLKVWAAYAGDSLGTDGSSAIEAYIRRMTSHIANSKSELERFAVKQLFAIGTKETIPVPESPDPDLPVETNPIEPGASPEVSDRIPAIPVKPGAIKPPGGVDALVENGFMVSYPGSRFIFSHPIIAGYLAGRGLSTSEMVSQVKGLPACTSRTLSLYYLAYFGDVSSLIQDLIQDDDILHTNHLQIARWLQVASKNHPWRSIVLRTLASVLQKERDTLSMAAKFMSALAFAGDEGVSVYFRQLLKAEHPILKQLGALGCGILADTKAVPELDNLLQETSPGSIRAASLALAAIGDKQSLEILATSLLNGGEVLRRCAAEALANDTIEGHPALKDGATMEDLMVRRAVAFGLMRVNLPWATKIVENMQLEDSEWVVRNAAIQAFEELKRKSNLAPKPLTDLTEAQWLADYAARAGTSVAPGKPAEDLVTKALANGTHDEILSALDYLREKCDPVTVENIFSAYTNNSGEIKDIAYYNLWLMLISGIKLPVAIKYNIK